MEVASIRLIYFVSDECVHVATFRNAGIDLEIADGKLVEWITSKSARCLTAPVHLAVAVEPDDEETEAQLFLEHVVADAVALEDEQQKLISEKSLEL
jgi:hypothetical protein